jgi:hypothetical protein
VTESDIEDIVKAHCHRRTEPVAPPTVEQWRSLERHFDCELPEELFHLRVIGSHYWLGGDHLPISEIPVVHDQERGWGEHWDTDLVPFYAIGNGDNLCVRRSEGRQSGVYYWAHDDTVVRRLHDSVASYILDREWFP